MAIKEDEEMLVVEMPKDEEKFREMIKLLDKLVNSEEESK